MNVLFYRFQPKYDSLVEKLRTIPGISICFAFNLRELEEFSAHFEPDILFKDSKISIRNKYRSGKPKIYNLESPDSSLHIVNEQTNQYEDINHIFNLEEEE